MPLSGDISNYIHQYQHSFMVRSLCYNEDGADWTGSPTKQKNFLLQWKIPHLTKCSHLNNFTSDQQWKNRYISKTVMVKSMNGLIWLNIVFICIFSLKVQDLLTLHCITEHLLEELVVFQFCVFWYQVKSVPVYLGCMLLVLKSVFTTSVHSVWQILIEWYSTDNSFFKVLMVMSETTLPLVNSKGYKCFLKVVDVSC
jgi:hypothetical protein